MHKAMELWRICFPCLKVILVLFSDLVKLLKDKRTVLSLVFLLYLIWYKTSTRLNVYIWLIFFIWKTIRKNLY